MIIDTHTHFFDPTRPQGIPWPKPNDGPLYRTVLPEHFCALAKPEGVTGTVVVEASRWPEDNQWILDLAVNNPVIVGFVGNLNPSEPDFETQLNRFAANPLFRGIRLGRSPMQYLLPDNLYDIAKKLADRDLEADLLIQTEELEATATLAKRLPELRIVINHIAHVAVTGNTPNAEWVNAIHNVAKHPNVYMKASALAERAQTQPAPTDVAYYEPTLDVLWNAFGEDRLIYGSNWPVCERAASYQNVINIVKAYFNAKGQVATDKYFCHNGKAAYKWIDRT